jgi:Na+-transporting NADH:ubiquinone oxidoreductase subunit C
VKINSKHHGYVIFYAAITSALFTGAIMALHKATEGVAERSARVFEQKSLVELFGLGDVERMSDEQIIEAYRRHITRGDTVKDPVSGETFELIRAWRYQDGRKTLIGYAFGVWGVGFWARIDGLLAVSPDLSRTIGVVFLKHSETPGLGGRITERSFREPFFRGLDISPPRPGRPYIDISHGEPPAELRGRHVDAITGATGTSASVAAFINRRLERFRRAMKGAGLAKGGQQAQSQ